MATQGSKSADAEIPRPSSLGGSHREHDACGDQVPDSPVAVVRRLLGEHVLGEVNRCLGDGRRVRADALGLADVLARRGPFDARSRLLRASDAASPVHGWDNPQPPAITVVCAAALRFNPSLMV